MKTVRTYQNREFGCKQQGKKLFYIMAEYDVMSGIPQNIGKKLYVSFERCFRSMEHISVICIP